jgi:hypothetical protein
MTVKIAPAHPRGGIAGPTHCSGSPGFPTVPLSERETVTANDLLLGSIQ